MHSFFSNRQLTWWYILAVWSRLPMLQVLSGTRCKSYCYIFIRVMNWKWTGSLVSFKISKSYSYKRYFLLYVIWLKLLRQFNIGQATWQVFFVQRIYKWTLLFNALTWCLNFSNRAWPDDWRRSEWPVQLWQAASVDWNHVLIVRHGFAPSLQVCKLFITHTHTVQAAMIGPRSVVWPSVSQSRLQPSPAKSLAWFHDKKKTHHIYPLSKYFIRKARINRKPL